VKITLTLKGDLPNFAAAVQRAQSPELMQRLGQDLVGIARRSFQDASLRAATWPARKGGGSHPLLTKSGALLRSFDVMGAAAGKVTVGAKSKYAAIHQFGGRTKPHEIAAGPGKVLAFTGTYKFFGIASAARKTFAKKVKHPGSVIPPRPYFPIKPGTSQLTDYAERALQWTAGVYLKNG
jgi:phage gpG-like protein